MQSSHNTVNPIADRQSSAELVNLAGAFRQAYQNVKSAKLYLWLLTFGLAVFQLLITFKVFKDENIVGNTILTASMVALLIGILLFKTLYKFLFLDPMQELACNIQQLHEYQILELGQAPSFTDARPARINDLSEVWLNKHPHDRRNLELWWPRIVSSVPFTYGKLICLLSSFQWEYQLRRKYQWFLWGVILITLSSSLVLMHYLNYLLSEYILLIFVPITPFLELILEEALTNTKCIQASKSATEKCVKLWDLLKSITLNSDQVEKDLHQLLTYWQQYYRLSATPILGWLYWLSLNVMDKEMTVDAQALIKEFNNN